MDLITIFLTGLLTGGLTCLAVQGGLLATSIAQQTEERLKAQTTTGHALPILSFLLVKLFAYTLLGFFLGWFGSLFQLSVTATVVMQIAVALFMIGTALNLLHVHPFFRYFALQPPRFLTRFLRRESKSKHLFAPALLGAFTIFVPCGTTQAMMALAIASGHPFSGALILFMFILGTSPVFFLLGYFATKLGQVFQGWFLKIAAFSLLFLAFVTINSSIALTGSAWTIDQVWNNVYCFVGYCAIDASVTPVSEETITITNNGYSPNAFAVKAGSKVTLHLVNAGGANCAQALTIPSLHIQKVVPTGKSDTVTFTAPNEPGSQIAFMCSMGMYRGTIQIL
jgi:uncharacterized protein